MKTGGGRGEGVELSGTFSPLLLRILTRIHVYTYTLPGTEQLFPHRFLVQLLFPFYPVNSFAIRVSIFKVKHLADIYVPFYTSNILV